MTNQSNQESVPGADDLSDEEAALLWRTFLEGAKPASLAAVERLFAASLPKLTRYCRFRLGDVHSAEDVAETVFVRLLATKPVLKSSFVGLLLGTARNLCNTELAKRATRPPTLPEPPDRAAADPSRELDRQDRYAALAECLDRLSEPDRTLVALRHGQGLTYRQISEVLGLRTAFSTFTRRLRRIMDLLRGCLKEKGIS